MIHPAQQGIHSRVPRFRVPGSGRRTLDSLLTPEGYVHYHDEGEGACEGRSEGAGTDEDGKGADTEEKEGEGAAEVDGAIE